MWAKKKNASEEHEPKKIKNREKIFHPFPLVILTLFLFYKHKIQDNQE